MVETIKKEWQAKGAILFFLLLTAWWCLNNFLIGNSIIKYDGFFDFGEFYGLMAVWGGIWGILISFKWGGIKTVIGKGILMFSLGLLLQEFGQLSYAWYYDFFKTPGPYPSLGDMGYFGSVLLYILGILYLAKASGVKVGLQSFEKKVQAVIIPLIILGLGYYLFLQGYSVNWNDPIKTFLDFGYPLFQAVYVSLAILTYLLSKEILGGVMKKCILFILLALCIQFLCDYTFLYQSSKGLYKVGEINDYMYFFSYFLMTLALLQFDTVFKKLKS